jgi:hypothetical protein
VGATQDAISEGMRWWRTEAADSFACRRNEAAASGLYTIGVKEWNTKNDVYSACANNRIK